MAIIKRTLFAPLRDTFLKETGLLNYPWEQFFVSVQDLLRPLGQEQSFPLVNNTSVAANVDGLIFDKGHVSKATVHMLIQRVTTGGSAVELLDHGFLIISYNPTAATWNISRYGSGVPDNTGVVLTITATGQVQYTTSNIGGTAQLSRIIWRAEILGGKTSVYSKLGAS